MVWEVGSKLCYLCDSLFTCVNLKHGLSDLDLMLSAYQSHILQNLYTIFPCLALQHCYQVKLANKEWIWCLHRAFLDLVIHWIGWKFQSTVNAVNTITVGVFLRFSLVLPLWLRYMPFRCKAFSRLVRNQKRLVRNQKQTPKRECPTFYLHLRKD